MVKIIGPLHSDHASKQLGKNVIFKTYGNRHFVTNYNKPASVKPFTPSPNQYNQRMLYNLIIARWQTLTDNQKDVYNDEAREKGLKMSGWNRFYQLAINDLPTYIGLQAYWPLNQLINDQLKDISGNNNHGTNHGATPTTDQKGKKKGAMSFNGVDNYINCGGNTSLNITDELTLNAWIYIKTASQNTPLVIVKASNYRETYRFGDLTNRIIFYGSHDGSNWDYNIQGKSHLSNNCWYNITATLSQSVGVRLYLNSELDGGSDVKTTLKSSLAPVEIGKLWDAYFFNGTIGTVLIYNRAQGPAELKKIYGVTKP